MLGDQDLKKTESHEQTFRVEKILKYSLYNEKDDIPHNDIGKYPLRLTPAGFSTGRNLGFGYRKPP